MDKVFQKCFTSPAQNDGGDDDASNLSPFVARKPQTNNNRKMKKETDVMSKVF